MVGANSVSLAGAVGGADGPTGPTGPTGPAGATGPTGASGSPPAGTALLAGTNAWTADNNFAGVHLGTNSEISFQSAGVVLPSTAFFATIWNASGVLYAQDNGGNATQLTPHSVHAPDEIYDEEPGIEHVYHSKNVFLGMLEFINFTRMARKADGEKLKGPCRILEAFDAFNKRLGLKPGDEDFAALQDWDAVQAAQAAHVKRLQQDQIFRRAAAAEQLMPFGEPPIKAHVKRARPAWLGKKP